MYRKIMMTIAILMLLNMIIGCTAKEPVIKATADVADVKQQLEKFAPVEIAYDGSQLSEGDHQALLKLVEAAKLMDQIFLRQVYDKNP
ncbi:MAG: peptidase, partial [Calditrichaeota bacterium]|nr:peptidase [Calditrichota bacterium]